MDNDDFVFKPATKQSSPECSNTVVSSNISDGINVSISSKYSVPPASNHSIAPIAPIITTTNTRFSALDSFIADKKRQMDTELNQLASERLQEFINKEREADRLRQEEFASMVQSPKSSSGAVLTEELRAEIVEKRAGEVDEKEAEMFKEAREKAKEVWKELEEEYKATLSQLYQEQAARLAQESQLQESLKASGAVFNRELFEKVVEKCGKGKNSVYAREKMARFWEVLERSHPESTFKTENTPDLDKDKLLASLLGM